MCNELCKIIQKHEHYEVYIDDEFYCSADTIEEAQQEIEEYMGKDE